ncbi:MAG: peptidylprolyl isomerase [Planctomycetia bacterium]|nr:peptidylprolyl isomerase [Planctomycetia bacterium]
MRNLHEKQSANRPWLRPALGLGMFGVTTFVVGLLLGLHSEGSPAVAQEPARHNLPDGPEPSSDYAQRVVAYIYGNIAVTREELGEYLIARFGPDKLELLVNKKIIEHACRQKGVEVTPAELELALETDCAKLGVTKDVFLNQVLRERKVTLYEWKEDVLKPQILLSKLCQDRVQATEDEIRMCYEAHYGEKIEVRIIMYPNDPQSQKSLSKLYERVRGSEEEFIKAAKEQPDANLAMTGGLIKPINRHAGNKQIEDAAFRLQPGEISEVIGTPGGNLIMRCVKRIPPDRTVVLENVKAQLTKEVVDKKLQLEVRKLGQELIAQAEPKLFLKKEERMADLKRNVEKELNEGKIQQTGGVEKK